MNNKMVHNLIDVWWRNNSNYYICSQPEIRLDLGPTNDACHKITMKHRGRGVTRILSPFYSFSVDAIFSTLDSMWDEITKPVRVHAKDYDIYDSVGSVVATYIDYSAVTKAFDNWCMNNIIKKVIFSDPCTIVIWNDGTKTIVRCTDEKFDKEKGLAMCIAKKSLGNKGKYYDVFKKWIEEE